jgi:RHS repeat-associated protein
MVVVFALFLGFFVIEQVNAQQHIYDPVVMEGRASTKCHVDIFREEPDCRGNVPHEQLSQQVVAEEAGYFYIYLSNESNTGSEAFFDDFSIQVSESFIVQQIDYYPYGLIARNVARTTDKQTKDLFQGKTYEDLTRWYDFHARQYDASLGRWFGTDPKAGVMPYNSPYSAMMNNPLMFTDPDGECPICIGILVGALIGAGSSAAVYTSTYFASGMGGSGQFWNGFGKAVAMGAVTGAIGGGIGGAFANSAFAQTLGYSLLNNTASTVAGNLILGNEITIGTVIGGIGGGLAGMGLPQFSGIKGGVLANVGAEIGYGAVRGAATGAVTGGIGAAIDGKHIGQGIGQGALAGAVGGATLGALNIAAMGPALYSGSFGSNTPIYRSGGLATLHFGKGEGIAIGRNLVVKQTGDFPNDVGLRFHEYIHFMQQRKLGSANFYARILGEYYQSGKGTGKWYDTYDTPGHLEYQAFRLESFFKRHLLPFKNR